MNKSIRKAIVQAQQCVCVQSDQDIDCPVHGRLAREALPRTKRIDTIISGKCVHQAPARELSVKHAKKSRGQRSAAKFLPREYIVYGGVNLREYYAAGYERGYNAAETKYKREIARLRSQVEMLERRQRAEPHPDA